MARRPALVPTGLRLPSPAHGAPWRTPARLLWGCGVVLLLLITHFPGGYAQEVDIDVHVSARFAVRLVGGRQASSGRVEVRRHGTDVWGMVCGNGLKVAAATVTCRTLNYTWGRPVAAHPYGAATGLILLDEVRCTGTERHLQDCAHNEMGRHNCTHSDAAAVQCSNSTVRILQPGNWGYVDLVEVTRARPICAAGWDDIDATVACREIGYVGGIVPRNTSLAVTSYLPYTSSAAVTDMGCSGNETALGTCRMSTDDTGCADRAMVVCYATAPNMSTVPNELSITSRPAGFVIINHRSVFKTAICSKQLTGADVNVTCRTLGYAMGTRLCVTSKKLPAKVASLAGVTSGYVPRCVGNETEITKCPGPDQNTSPGCSWNGTSSEEYLAVLCSNETVRIRLVQSPNATYRREGQVQLYHGGAWGVICDPGWGHREAEVACRQLGHVGGVAVKWQDPSVTGSSPVYLGRTMCNGSEANILSCPGDGWEKYNSTFCMNPANYAAVRCYDRVRLGTLRTYAPGYGNLEVLIGSSWSLVCGSPKLSVLEARVICREIGFSDGAVPRTFYTQTSSLPVANLNFTCDGKEERLADCKNQSLPRCPNVYINHAVVYCHNGHIADESYLSLSDSTKVNSDYANITGPLTLVRNGLATRICIDDWTDEQANVACKQLNFKGGVAFSYKGALPSLPVTYTGLNCTGGETNLNQCPYLPALGLPCTATAGVLCYQGEGIKMSTVDAAGNKTRNAGLVMIEYDGHRGHVCDSQWTDIDAKVVCRSLGFADGIVKLPSVQAATLMMSTTPAFLNAVTCTGSEISLFTCTGTGWNNPRKNDNCPSVGVVCYNNVRLDPARAHYNSRKGIEVSRVQVSMHGEWGFVCGTGFTDIEAHIVCTELGWTYGKSMNPAHLSVSLISRRYNIWLRRVSCFGNETSLLACNKVTDIATSCENSNINRAAVICSSSPINEGIAMTIGSNGHGYVKVTRYGIEGKVCSTDWNDKVANVVCVEQGYKGGVAMSYNTYRIYEYASRSIVWLLKYTCLGNETSLEDCNIMEESNPCTTTKDIGVLCYLSSGVKYKLRGDGRGKGWAVIVYDDVPGSICDHLFSTTDARIMCRSLGYMDGKVIRGADENLPAEPTTMYVSKVSCLGQEKTILQCGSNGWNNYSPTYCGYGHAVAVQCFHAVRLSNQNRDSTGSPVGEVQVYYNNRWGLVCDSKWDNKDAKVLCHQLGYASGFAYPCQLFGNRRFYYSYVWNNVECVGTEAHLANCTHDARVYMSCPSRSYASAMCFDTIPSISAVEYRFTGNKLKHIGAVEVKYAGQWGRVCPNKWNDEAAKVLCRSLQHGVGGFAYISSSQPTTSMPYWLNGVQCTGTEISLLDCSHSDLGNSCGCGLLYSAGAYCYSSTGFEIRLADGGDNYGRVEIGVDGQWGTICDYRFQDSDANVICRMLNYTSGSAQNNAKYGSGNGPYWVTSVTCEGNETSLLQCLLTGWDLEQMDRSQGVWSRRCPSSHIRDAGVYCYGNVRLKDSSLQDFGRLQVYTSDKWQQVCDDGSFGDKAADVACQQLGYSSGTTFCCSSLGNTESISLFETSTLTSVRCLGNETDIRQCAMVNGSTCQQKEYISVACTNLTENVTSKINVTLQHPNKLNFTGQLRVTAKGVTGRVCSKLWDERDAKVICRELGFLGGVIIKTSLGSSLPFVLGEVNCTGDENSLSECPHTEVGRPTGCVSLDNDAGVLCYNTSGGINFQLTGNNPPNGQIEISRDGKWGTVCSYGWGLSESKVFCKQMGFVDGATHRVSTHMAIDRPMYISFVNCKGTESNLLECTNQGWGNVPSYCRRYYSSVHVYCFGNVRLTIGQSFSTMQGAVQIFHGQKWTLVCDEGWDELDARVVCKQMGYLTGYATCCSAYGFHYETAMYSNFLCSGNESSLLNCSHETVIRNNRCDYASAICVNTTTNTDYRLSIKSQPQNQYTGRLEVTYAGVKGRVCSDGWNNTDATVACRELQYTYGEAYTHYEYRQRWTSSHIGPWWVTGVQCSGSEAKLSECPSMPWGMVRTCESEHTAGVLCYNNDGTYFRIVNGSDSRSGRVEMAFEGHWGTVCDNYWDTYDARALCRQLGFVDGRARFNSDFGRGTGKAWLLRYSCNGSEDSLYECPHQGFTPSSYHSCTSHANDAGVECYSTVRLDSGSSGNQTMGPVLFFNKTKWFTLCDDTFDDKAADVVCRSLGYAFGRTLCCSSYGSINYQMVNMSVNCTGSEADINDCMPVTGCTSMTYASVFCFKHNEIINDTAYDYKLQTSAHHGSLSVYHWARQGRICAQSWGDNEAMVWCRSHGYLHGISYGHFSRQRRSRRPFIMGKFNCTGAETSLDACPYADRLHMGLCSTKYINAGVVCFQNISQSIDFRLANGPTPQQGRVEMAMGDVWGTICDLSWDNHDAAAVCRQMGYSDGVAQKKSFYGPGNGTVWISRVHCAGTETSLLQCPNEGFNVSSGQSAQSVCGSSHEHDAGVYCYSTITIGNRPNKTHGMVRVYRNNTWNLVCVSGFSSNEALVTCRHAGFKDGRVMPRSAFGQLVYKVTIPYIKCPTGNETSLTECKIAGLVSANDSCPDGGGYASVYCSHEMILDSEFAVRISEDERSKSYYGLLEVRMGGLWGRICRNQFSKAEADVACREMGFIGGEAYQHLAVNFLPVFMSNVSCSGSEESLMKCNYTRWGDDLLCANGVFEAGVICYNHSRSGFSYRLGGTNNNSTGRVEIRYNGTWGTICDLGWGISDARVMCGQLGFKDGLALSSSHYGAGTGPVWVHSFSCLGNETSLLTCPNSGWNTTWDVNSFYRCKNHGRDASVNCFTEKLKFAEMRLANRGSVDRGRVEIYISPINKWGTVCDDSWDDKDATVVCRYLGYESGEAVGNARFGQGKGQIWLDEVKCNGNETSLQDCDYVGLGNHDCYHFEDAGVICSYPITTPTLFPPSTTTLRATSTTAITASPVVVISSSAIATTPTPTSTPLTVASTSVATPLISSSLTTTITPTTTTPTTTTPTTTTPTTTTPTTTTPTTTTPTTTTPTTTTPTTTTPTTTTPTTTTPTTTTSTSITSGGPVSTKLQEGGMPVVAVVVPLVLIFLLAMVLLGAGLVWYRRQSRGRPFGLHRLQEEDSADLTMDAHPVALDPAKPNGDSCHFTNMLYNLDEADNDAAGIVNEGLDNGKSGDASNLVKHDFLQEELDFNPLYENTGNNNKKTSSA